MTFLVQLFLLLHVVWWLPALVAASATFDYTCTPSATDSPGVSLPRGDIYLLNGTEQELTCLLNPRHAYYTRAGFTARDLYFWTPETGALEAERVNDTAIRTVFRADRAGITDVSCLLRNGSLEGDSSVGICHQRIYAGFLPLGLANFSCVSENWHNLLCNWDKPANPVPTHNEIDFIEPGIFSHPKKCPKVGDHPHLTEIKFPEETCYLDLKTDPPYRQTVHTFSFYVNSTNPLKPSGEIYHIRVDHFSVVKPGEPVGLSLEPTATDAMQLNYSVPDEMREFWPGLIQDVRFASEWEPEKWQPVESSSTNPEQDVYSFFLQNLTYAYTLYTAQIRMISATADRKKRPDLWSDVVEVSKRTAAARPASPPQVDVGSFEVVETGSLRTVYAYWRLMEPREFNGPQFSYLARKGTRGRFQRIESNHSYAKFVNCTRAELRIQVTAENSEGSAPLFSNILVPQAAFLVGLEPKAVTKIWKGSRHYEVAWRHPDRQSEVTSYTLFWCRSAEQKERPYQCDGDLDWRVVGVGDGRVQTENLLFPTKDVYQIAVSANTGNLSSGMSWSTCTVIEDRLVSRVTRIQVLHHTSTSLLVAWSLDCSDQAGIVYGYRIEFCTEFECKTEDVSPDHDKFKLEELAPFTTYKVGVRIQNSDGFGDLGLQVVATTDPDRPGSPPTQLAAGQLTADSALLSWAPPKVPNGKIGEYHVRFAYFDALGRLVGHRQSATNNTRLKIDGLLSYSRYSVNVTACNWLIEGSLGCSHHAAPVGFITKVGLPAQPPPPTVQFINATLVNVTWSRLFQIGAPAAHRWELKVRRAGKAWSSVNPYSLNVTGRRDYITIRLDEVNSVRGWSPDCENQTNTNMFEFGVRVVVQDAKRIEYAGPWSRGVARAAYCRHPSDLWWIYLTCILVPLATVVGLVVCYRCYNYWYSTKDFFGKVGKELESKFVLTAATENIDGDGSPGPEFEMSQLGKGPLPKDGRDDDNAGGDDSDTLLLEEPGSYPNSKTQRQKSASESATSDLTSGGESHGGKSSSSAATDRTSECSGQSTAPLATDLASNCSGYVSMCPLDSVSSGGGVGSSYTQFQPARQFSTLNPCHPLSVDLADAVVNFAATPPPPLLQTPGHTVDPPSSSAYLARPPSRSNGYRQTPPLDPMLEEPSLTESNTSPGYSLFAAQTQSPPTAAARNQALLALATTTSQSNPPLAAAISRPPPSLLISPTTMHQTPSPCSSLPPAAAPSSPLDLPFPCPNSGLRSPPPPSLPFPTIPSPSPCADSTFSQFGGVTTAAQSNPYEGFLSGASMGASPAQAAGSIDRAAPSHIIPNNLSARPKVTGYISVQQAQELVLQPNPNSNQYSRVGPRLDESKSRDQTAAAVSPTAAAAAVSYNCPSFV